MGKQLLTIVIPTLNEAQFLPELLEDLTEQTYQDFSVIVVDAHSEDTTVKAARAFKKELTVSVINSPVRNVSTQRNLGTKKADTEWIIFLDADVRIDSTFIEKVADHCQTKAADVFAPWTKASRPHPSYLLIITALNVGMEIMHSIGKTTAPGACIIAKKAVCAAIPFDENKQVFEDGYFLQEAIAAGFKFCYLKQPQYVFSLRRFSSNGLLQTSAQAAYINLRYIGGELFESKNFGYTMDGGSEYTDESITPVKQLRSFIKDATESQREFARKLLVRLKDELPFS